MGNCLKSVSSHDDISLLRENTSNTRDSTSSEQLTSSLGPPPTYLETIATSLPSHPVYYPSPNVSRTATQLTEEEQIKIAQRMGLIQHLPTGIYDGSKKNRECVICMGEFMISEPIRFLPCMHIYHTDCIDDWLMRSFTCPSCLEPVDAALLSTYQTD
ncbi:RING finger protein 11-like [Oppia nitens]|uniref:RING finger protein 11-like n=1 Tax=Oppia nitens TaxID=1686743 RepID=UPI0023DA445F|nr:RING finger protein 11-like [Oppia nitens]